MLSTFKEGSKVWHGPTSDFPALIPPGLSITSPIQPATNTGLKAVLVITGGNISRSTGDVTYQVRPETIAL